MDYEVVRKTIHHMYLRVKPDGTVVVSAPRRMSQAAIEAFVASRRPWIERQRQRQASRPTRIQKDATGHEFVTLWGVTRELVTVQGSRYSLELTSAQAAFTVPRRSSQEAREKGWREMLRRLLVDAIEARRPHWEAVTGLRAREWRTKFMTTRWGTCSIAARRIWLNVSLVHYPPECLDYVMVHELVHLKERTHGPRFQALMDRFYPNWRTVRRELNR